MGTEAPMDPQGRAEFDRAQVLLQAGKDREALPLLRSCAQRSPSFVRVHLLYQDTAMRLGGDDEAGMRAFYASLPGDTTVTAYAKARLLESDFERNQALEAILRRDSSFSWAHLSRARLLRSVGRIGEAIASYRKALSCDGDLLTARLELAEVLVEVGKEGEAASHYENYLRGAPLDLSATRACIALLVYRLGRPEAAMPLIRRLLERDPDDEAAKMDEAAALWRMGKCEDAKERYLRILEKRSGNARAALNLGNLYYEVLARTDEDRLRLWPKAAAAYRIFANTARPEDGLDYVDLLMAVPYRLGEIERFLQEHGVDLPERSATLDDLRD